MTVESIAKTLGTGSGIDIGALVTSLIDAQYANRTRTLDTRQEALTAQISTVSEIRSAITNFSNALNSLATSGTLGSQATSSRTDVVRASTITGSRAGNVNATIEIRQLARAQTVQSGSFPAGDSSVGVGTLSFSFGDATQATGVGAFDIVVEPGHDSLEAIASSINAANKGITASIVTDGDGQRLMLKGQTGASQAFHVAASDPSLSRFELGGANGAVMGQSALDAEFVLDGFEMRRASNTISNVIPGVRLELASAAPGSVVQIASATPTAALSQAVEDIVATYNEMLALVKAATDPKSGPLRADPAMRSLERSLQQLTSTILLPDAPAGTPRTLAEIGIATNRDGTLRVETAQLTRLLTENPGAIEAMLQPNSGLPKTLAGIAAAAADRNVGLGASEQRYARDQTKLTEERLKVTDQAEATRTRMTQQFASMDAKVAAYKSTQTFLAQQIDVWNAQRELNDMVRYATRLSGDPADTYRTIDVASRAAAADSHQLVEMLYEELVRALESAAWAIENGDPRLKADRVTRATAIFFALENGLDYDRGGDVARTLGTLYRALRQQVIDASLGNDPAPFRSAGSTLAEIAGAWASVRAS